jgi:two-component system NarL family response regulator
MDERVRHKPDLTSRDIEILLLVGEGLQNKEIAGRLDLSMKTVEFHKHRLYLKIGVTGGIGAVRFAIREGYMKA